MPARSNFFQRVVAVIHEHMAGDATVQESAFLTARSSGEVREVDVVIRSATAGYETVVSVEATSTKRPAEVGWVERMLGKHDDLPTDKLVLISEAGFTPQARARATTGGALPLSPEELGPADPTGKIVNNLASIWPKVVSLDLQQVRVYVERPDGNAWFKAEPDHMLYLDDGREAAPVQAYVHSQINKNWPKVMEDIGLRDIDRDLDRIFQLEMDGLSGTVDGNRHRLCVRWEQSDPPELHPVTRLVVTGPATIRVSEVSLQHRRLGEVRFSAGDVRIGDQRGVLVATEADDGGKMTVRFDPSTPKTRRKKRKS